MKTIFGILFLFISVQLFAQKISESSPVPFNKDIRTGTLSNGMKYYILKNQKPEKRAELRLVVNVGSNMEDEDQQGLAHFVEHMAFNGTKNFKKNDLINYLESVGTKFGPHLNAYTSFDETVYMIQIPSDKPDILNKGFQILEDWAHNLSFDSLEIEKERGVVIEEWRLRKGAGDRMQAKYFPVMFKDSRYADRLPIGKKDILENFRHDVLKRFYNEWYRPELMSVVVVGDIDPVEIEKKIKEQFSKIQKKKNPRPRKDWPMPDHDGPLVSIATDKEATSTNINILYKHPLSPSPKKIADLKTMFVTMFFNDMFSARIDEMGRKSDAPFAYAYGYSGQMVRTKNNYVLYAVAKEGKMKEAMEAIIRENRRIIEHGFTQTELDRIKKSYQVGLEKDVKEKGKRESSSLTWEIVNGILNNEPMMSEESMLQVFNILKDKITLQDVNAIAPKLTLDAKNTVIVITAPEKENVKIPAEAEVLKWYAEFSKMKTDVYVDNFIEGPLVKNTPEAKATIEKEEKNEALGIVTWKLSNGAVIRYKKTEFKNDEILFQAKSRGGLSLISDQDFLTARIAASIIDESGIGAFNSDQLTKYLSDKVVGIYPFISNTHEGFGGSCSPNDLETMMQLLYLYFTEPGKDEEAFKSLMAKQKTFIENRSLSPNTPFNDSISCVSYNYHYRVLPMTVEKLAEVSLESAYKIFRERFVNPADFTYYFVGNIDETKLREFVLKYIGSAPPSKISEITKDNKMRPVTGTIEREIKKGVEPKSSVYLRTWGESAAGPANSFELNAMIKLLSIKLRENLREDKSGVYGVGANGFFQRYPMDHYTIIISFGCAPDNVKMLVDAALEEITKIKSTTCTPEDLTKVKEAFRRERETDAKTNRFWLNSMVNADDDGTGMENILEFEKWVDALTAENIKTSANKYLTLKNYSKFILNPEK